MGRVYPFRMIVLRTFSNCEFNALGYAHTSAIEQRRPAGTFVSSSEWGAQAF